GGRAANQLPGPVNCVSPVFRILWQVISKTSRDKGGVFMRSMTLFVATAALLALTVSGGAQEKKGGARNGGGIQLPPMIHIQIEDFSDGGHIPSKYTCAAGQNSPSPAITWSGAPANTQSYALIM